MLSNRNWIIVAIAAFIGLIAVILANSYLSGVEKREERVAQENRMVQIAVARVPIPYGTALTPENTKMVSWPESSMPQGAFRSTKGLFAPETRVVIRPLEAGEPILPAKVTGEGGRASISALLDPAMRAVAVRINDVAGVAGFVLPGDSVDVLLTREPSLAEGKVDKITDVLLQNIRVIAVDQNANDTSTETKVGKTVTLAVDPTGAQKLALAGQVGSLSLALRNAADQDQAFNSTVGTRDLGDGNLLASYVPGSRGAAQRSAKAVPTGPQVAIIAPPTPMPSAVERAASTASRAGGEAPKKRATIPGRGPTTTVQIVRGTNSSDYEVRRFGGF